MLMVKMQFACLCVLLYIGFYYFKIKRLDITSAYIFQMMLFAGVVNLIFDAVTVYTVSHSDSVAPLLNRLCHQLFIGSLDIFIFLICYYILSIIEGKQKLSIVGRILILTPLLFSIVMVLFAPLYYNTSGPIAYSYGPMAITCYSSVGLYLILALSYIIKYWRNIDKRKREAILPVLLLLICISLFQLFTPTALISGVGIALVLLGIFMTMENPAEYLTNSSELFNHKAFSLVTEDRVHINKGFTVIGIAFRELALTEEKREKNEYDKLVLMLNEFVSEKFSLPLYVPHDGSLAIIVDDKKKVPVITKSLKERFQINWEIEQSSIMTNATVSSFSFPTHFTRVPELFDLLKMQVENSRWHIAYMDRNLGIKNRNGFERMCTFICKNLHEFSSIWYLMIDVNNLKTLNDTMGHLAGDKLLQDCADVLTEAVETDVYRIGGDEFAILLVSKTTEQIHELLGKIESCRLRCNENRTIPLSFAIGCSKFDEQHDGTLTEMIERADREMYEQKLFMKKTLDEAAH